MKTGILHREVEFETERGQRLLMCSTRLVSFEHRHLAAMSYEASALDGPVRIVVSSELVTHGPGATSDDPRRGKGFAEKVLVPVERAGGRRRAPCSASPRATAASSWRSGWSTKSRARAASRAEGDGARVVVLADLEAGEQLSLSKYVAYHWSAARRRRATSSTASTARSTAPGSTATRRSSASTRGT